MPTRNGLQTAQDAQAMSNASQIDLEDERVFVAAMIATAAQHGRYVVVIEDGLSDDVYNELMDNGYEVVFLDEDQEIAQISWEPEED